jgi:hypothetical protein
MTKKEILFSVTKKDLRVEYFRTGGPGGQKQNKTSSGCRITHPASGAKGEARETRSQHQNRKLALQRLAESKEFRTWVRFRVAGCDVIEQKVDFMMDARNILIEGKEDGKWVELDVSIDSSKT